MAETDLLPRPVREKAANVAEGILRRLTDPESVDEAAESANRLTRIPLWISDVSLYAGSAGISMALSVAAEAFDERDDSWRSCAKSWLRRAAESTHDIPLMRAGFEHGSAGIALAIGEYAGEARAGSRALERVVEGMALQVDHMAKRPPVPLAFHEYDTMSGRAGILGCASLLAESVPVARRIAREVATQLTTVARAETPDDRWRSWRIPPEGYPPRKLELLERYPNGCVDLGLAHGIPGPLAALCCAWRAGYQSEDIEQAISTLSALLVEAAQPDEGGPRWPRYIGFDDSGAIAPQTAAMSRDTYCYGTPGLCSALLDAADVLGDGELRALAVTGFDAALWRICNQTGLPVASHLCHGVAGLLLLCWKFAQRTDSQAAREAVVSFTEELLDRCDDQAPLLIREFHPVVGGEPGTPFEPRKEGVWVDIPGLIEGAAGVALTLMSVSTPTPMRWARSLLVA